MKINYYRESRRRFYFANHDKRSVYTIGVTKSWYCCVYNYENFLLDIDQNLLTQVSIKTLILNGIEEYAP